MSAEGLTCGVVPALVCNDQSAPSLNTCAQLTALLIVWRHAACLQLLEEVKADLERNDRAVDVVLLVDRLDLYRVDDLDQQVRPCTAVLHHLRWLQEPLQFLQWVSSCA